MQGERPADHAVRAVVTVCQAVQMTKSAVQILASVKCFRDCARQTLCDELSTSIMLIITGVAE